MQALKFTAEGKHLASIGTRQEPGNDAQHLCMPSAVGLPHHPPPHRGFVYCIVALLLRPICIQQMKTGKTMALHLGLCTVQPTLCK